jgi:hexosaminidase
MWDWHGWIYHCQFLSNAMKGPIALTIMLGIVAFNAGCTVEPSIEPSIIPRPQQLAVEAGTFSIDSSTTIYLSSENPALKSAAEYFALLIEQSSGTELPIGQMPEHESPANAITLVLEDRALGDEGYELAATKNGIRITAGTAQGIFYGLQSIRQLLPSQIESSERVEGLELSIPLVQIKDQPRYAWRGLMLDESRHFFGKTYVKKLLDQMALLKLNVFHWHLTDAPGWRLEIEKYPKLTTIGSIGNKSDPTAPATYYTQDDVREIVAYAAERFIQVLPEIDMPGHATAANRAYPENSGGGNEKRPDFTFNPGREETYSFLTDILEETAELFPAPWIHYGGDEVHFANEQWTDLPDVKALMARHDLDDLKDVEHHFNQRMADVIHDLGKKVVAWDEVVDAGVDPDKTIIIWWRHNIPEQLTKALDEGHQVVLSPRRPLYFDFVQDDSHEVGRRWEGFNDLKQVYNFSGHDNAQVLGMQASMWTETVQTKERADFMIFPRLTAIAEAAWTDGANKDYEHYRQRLRAMLERYKVMGINYFDPFAPEKTPEPQT